MGARKHIQKSANAGVRVAKISITEKEKQKKEKTIHQKKKTTSDRLGILIETGKRTITTTGKEWRVTEKTH